MKAKGEVMAGRKGKPGRPSGVAKYTKPGRKTRVAAEGYRRVAFFVPVDLGNRLKAAAALEGMTISGLLIRLIEKYLKEVRI
jgi:hypothetical protein